MRSQLCSVNRLQQVDNLADASSLTSALCSAPADQSASYRVALAGLELEVVCFVKHGILLHEQLLIELLDYLRGGQRDRQTYGVESRVPEDAWSSPSSKSIYRISFI